MPPRIGWGSLVPHPEGVRERTAGAHAPGTVAAMAEPAGGTSPAIVGVGQVANHDEDRIVHPVELVGEATRAALDDAGLTLADVRGVLASPLTVRDAVPASDQVAEHLDLAPGLRVTAAYSGCGPHRLLGRALAAVAEGGGPVLVVGGIADASVARARRQGVEPPAAPTAPWSQGSEQAATRRPRALRTAEVASGAGMPPSWFALVESARPGATLDGDHRRRLGELLAPFTEVAAGRPDLAWFPTTRSPAEIARPTPDNRLVAEPYTKRMCSFPTVDLAATAVVAPAPVDDERAVRPRALVAGRQSGPPSTWRDMGRFEAMERTVAAALASAGVEPVDLAAFDLYSCFPAAVELALDAFGVAADDPRPFTATGGLPYFGGPGASYSLHGLVSSVERLRTDPGSLAAVVGVGGMVTDASAAVLGIGHELGPVVTLDPVPAAAAIRETADGPAVVDAMTVLHDRDRGPVAAPVVARLPDGSRVGARAADPGLPAATSGSSLVGRRVELRTDDDGHVTYALP